MYAKGHKFYGPNGMGYEMKESKLVGETVRAEDLLPFGGAEEPVNGAVMPGWLYAQLQSPPSQPKDNG